MPVECIIDDDRWSEIDLDGVAHAAVKAVLTQQGIDAAAIEIALLAGSDAQIAVLNADFRGKSAPTNVLSFPAMDHRAHTPGARPDPPVPEQDAEPYHLGDVALAFETCAREARAAGKPLGAHVTHLIVHGVLHLLGYDHVRDADATLMERTEVEILGNLGLPDPYTDTTGP